MRSLLIALLCTVTASLAQTPTGTISGTIKDSSGAVVPNATITITNKATAIARTLAANAEGLYSAPALAPGDYEVRRKCKVSALPFAPLTCRRQHHDGRYDAPVGEAKEVVMVEAATAQINYDNNAIAGVIERQTIEDIPLNGRSSLQLAHSSRA